MALKGFPEKTNRDDIMFLLSTYGLSFDTVHMDRNGASCKVTEASFSPIYKKLSHRFFLKMKKKLENARL